MKKPRDKGDYGITPTEAEKRRLTGEEPAPGTPPEDEEQKGTADQGDEKAGHIPPGQQDAAGRTHTPYQEGGLG